MRYRRRFVRVMGVLLLIGAVVGVGYPLWWQHRQAIDGSREIHRLASMAVAGCTGASSAGPGVLRIPAVAVVAPVVEGTSEAVLAISVGHESSSPWPGQQGTSVLEAHDVGYFASNQLLRPGDIVTYTRACRTYRYRVVGYYILRPGDTIPSPGPSGLVLDSCWPTDALWFTPSRLIVTAVLTGVRSDKAVATGVAPTPLVPQLPRGIPAPPNLFDEGWLAGTLTFTGMPALAWKDGPAPLAWESVGLRAFSALRMGEQTRASWLSLLAPGMTPPLILGGDYASGTPVDVAEEVQGTSVHSVTITTRIQGVQVSVTSTAVAGKLRVTAIES
ncbi:sortase [Ferrimicrobium sp.]|uniref:sortase domain-containing protein n=1 Tax=Ferrimicrobium sp. TaxID=2926050 RepID=UPI00261FC5C1|nr:sortase [Ferrimicrobium sp.]